MIRPKFIVNPLLESLERRRLLTISVVGSVGADLIRITSNGSQVQVFINGVQSQFAPDSAGIVVTAGDGNDTIRLEDASNLPVTIDGGAADDRIEIGAGNVRGAHLAAVSVIGGTGQDTLVIDDSLASTGNPSVTIDNPIDTYVSIVAAPGSSIRSDASTAASAVESVIYSGTPSADVVSILGTNALVSLAVNGNAGADSITVGNDIDTTIKGPIALDGGADSNTVTFDDSGDSFADTYYIANIGLLGSLHKNSGGSTTTFTNFSSGSLTAGLAGRAPNNQFFRISSLPATINFSIYAGSGDDALYFGDGVTSLSAIQANLTFYGEGDIDSIAYNDGVGSNAASYQVGPSSITNSAGGTLNFFDCESLLLTANNAANDIRTTTLPDTLSVTLNGGGGDDTIHVGNGDVESNLKDSISVLGGAGNDSLIIDDTLANLTGDGYAVFAGGVQKGITAAYWSTATSDRVESVSLLGSANSDTIQVFSATPSIALSINSGDGDDAIQVASTNDGSSPTPGMVTVVSGTGNDTLDVNSDFSGSDAIVAIPASENLKELDIRGGGEAVLTGGSASIETVRGQLNIAGHLDIADSTLIASGADSAGLQSLAIAGYANGAWNGGGSAAAIVSSVAAASSIADVAAVALADDLGLPTFGGVKTNAGDVILRYTIAGDATLDRQVNFSDLVILAQHYGQTGQRWSQGNFSYDVGGSVNFADLVVIAQNYGQSIPQKLAPISIISVWPRTASRKQPL